ncbi:hypothetical protein [Agromyces kandeliae]|uniref:Galactosyltransferase C-terminal domain-containing protein n=1 Tax=Agromyces kandeliae TaxID=2666141 RepID=A0A6L5QZ59_9MICO|nr:hypothetical protein [Agromyces kandeliae]MRX43102.1 hypothetical protein [Agromyces kandeliae]
MTNLVVIPWRPAPSRIPAFDRVLAWYRAELPEFRVETIDSDDDVFVLARARNLAVARLAEPDDVVVINDADTLPEAAALREAVAEAGASGRVHLPYTTYRWLGPEGTAELEAGVPLADCSHVLVRGACSGVYVTTARTWAAHGGQDERFRGWGFEDSAWRLAHETMLGMEPHRHGGAVYALSHEPEVRAGEQYDRNAALMARYRDAEGDVDAMAALIAEAQAVRASNATSGPGLAA